MDIFDTLHTTVPETVTLPCSASILGLQYLKWEELAKYYLFKQRNFIEKKSTNFEYMYKLISIIERVKLMMEEYHHKDFLHFLLTEFV